MSIDATGLTLGAGIAPAVYRLAAGGALQDNANTNGPTLTLVAGPSGSAVVTTGANRYGVGQITLTNYGAFTSGTAATISGVIAPLSQSGGGTTRTITVADTPAANDLIISAAIVDGVGNVLNLTKAGGAAGRLVLSGANTYTGVTTLNANTGYVQIQSNTALGSFIAGTTVNGGSALELANGVTVTDEAITNSSVGVLGLNPTALGNTLMGTGGVRSVGGSNVLASSLTNQAGIVLTSVVQSAIGADGGSTLTVNGVLNFNGQNTLKVGTGTLVLAGAAANVGGGATFVNEGTLLLNKTGAVNAITNNLTIGDNRGGQDADVVQYGAAAGGTDQIGAVTVTVQSSGRLDLSTNNGSDAIGA